MKIEVKAKMYKKAGVDLDRADAIVKAINSFARSTFRPEVISDIGGFGALFSLNTSNFKKPVLVSSSDGVGTKLKVAFMANKHDTVGIDLVAMSVNDICVQGAEPLFFLDYLAMGKIDIKKAIEIIKGISDGCRIAGCALIGGETAEMPGFYAKGEYELAGFCVGVVDQEEIIDGSSISVNDKILGLASSGLHSNGYSLARRVLFGQMKMKIGKHIPELGRTIGEELLEPTRIYSRIILNLIRNFKIKGMAHITGGGLMDNIPRILPSGCKAIIKLNSWEIPPIFEIIRKWGKISRKEMLRVFNNGIGMVIVVREEDVDEISMRLQGLGQKAFLIGEIKRRTEGEPPIEFID
jgi:phosphoribosylformylglycinamidine cyclo-ligase